MEIKNTNTNKEFSSPLGGEKKPFGKRTLALWGGVQFTDVIISPVVGL